MSLSSAAPALQFRLLSGSAEIDCVVTQDAIEALAGAQRAVTAKQRRFLEGIAAERLEWSRQPQKTIIIDAWDIETHRQGA